MNNNMSTTNDSDVYTFTDTELDSDGSSTFNLIRQDPPEDVIPNCGQAIVLPANFKTGINDYLRVIADIVGAKNILFASYYRVFRVCIYLKSCELADDFVSKYSEITIEGQKIKVEKLVPKRRPQLLELLNLPPHIPHQVVENALKKLNISLTSPITFVPMTFTNETDQLLFKHVLGFRRHVYFRPKDQCENVTGSVPLKINIRYLNEEHSARLKISRISILEYEVEDGSTSYGSETPTWRSGSESWIDETGISHSLPVPGKSRVTKRPNYFVPTFSGRKKFKI